MKSLKGKKRARKKAAKRLLTRFKISDVNPDDFKGLNDPNAESLREFEKRRAT